MLERIKQAYRSRSRLWGGAFLGAVLAAWLLGPVLANVLDLQQSFLVSFAVLVLMLAAIQDYLNDLVSNGPAIAVSRNQTENTRSVHEYVQSRRVGDVWMIEYDAESVRDMISHFLESGATVSCLLQHPDSAVSALQRQRIVHQILSVRDHYPDEGDRIKFSYYLETASLRGRLIDGDFVCVGWYTYDRRDPDRRGQVWGHNNPVIELDARSPDGAIVRDFFDRTYQNLLGHSVPWHEVYEQYVEKPDPGR